MDEKKPDKWYVIEQIIKLITDLVIEYLKKRGGIIIMFLILVLVVLWGVG